MKFRKISILVVTLLLVFTISACNSGNGYIETPSETTNENKNNTSLNETESTDENDEVSEHEEHGGELEPLKFTSGEFEGQYNPADIRGSYSIADISKYFDIPVSVLCEAFQIPVEEADNVQNKYYNSIYEGLVGSGKSVGNGSMVVFVSIYKGIPFELHEPEYLLESAKNILTSLRQLSEEEMDYLEKYSVTIEEASPINIADLDSIDEHEEEHDDEFRIYGQTTFGDLIQMGLTSEQISAIIDAPTPDLSTKVKDYCVTNGLGFSEQVKPELLEVLYSLQD